MSQYIDSIATSGDDNLLTVWGTMVNTREVGAPATMPAPSGSSSDRTMLYLTAAGVIIAAIALFKMR